MEGLDTTAALDSTRRGRHEFSLGPGGGCQNLRLHDEMVAVSHDVHVVEIDGGGREGLPALSAYGSQCAAREAREVIDPTRTLPFAFALRAESSKCSLVSRLVGRRRCHPAISRPQLPTQPRRINTNPPTPQKCPYLHSPAAQRGTPRAPPGFACPKPPRPIFIHPVDAHAPKSALADRSNARRNCVGATGVALPHS